jgi:hypothetical protein
MRREENMMMWRLLWKLRQASSPQSMFPPSQKPDSEVRAAAPAMIAAKTRMILLVLASLICLGVNSCTAGDELRWTKIGEGEGYNKEGRWTDGRPSDFVYVGGEPRLVAIRDEVAVPTLQDRVLPSHLRRISRTDFSTNWVAVIYQGYKCRPGYSIQVSAVELGADSIIIHAQFHKPADPEDCLGILDTSPYYALRIRKPAAVETKDLPLFLEVDDWLISEACATPGEYVPWTPLVNNPGAGGHYEERAPRLAIVTSQSDLSYVETDLLSIYLEQVSEVDFSKSLVIIVFQGEKPTTGYSVEVISIRRQANTVWVCAQSHEPESRQATGQSITSPYYIAQVEWIPDVQGEFTFVLVDHEKEVARQRKTIP